MEKSKVFVLMPFEDEFFESYELLKYHFSECYKFSNAGEIDNQQNILADIIQPIYDADVIIADLTKLNPNVMYELGIAHSFNKKTIIITRDELDILPFDLKQYRVKKYSTHFKQFNELIEYLNKHLSGAADGTVYFSNPVGDFLVRNKLSPQEIFETDILSLEMPDSEIGFLDFLSEIEEDATRMSESLNKISEEMNVMSSGLNECTAEVERQNKIGGSGTASFVRKQSRKAAGHISIFSKSLKEQNSNIQSLWEKIEKNSMGLLENKFTEFPENQLGLKTYIGALYTMKDSIMTSNDSVTELIDVVDTMVGLERSLNHSAKFLIEDLSTYLNVTEQIMKSIDRIIGKSRFIIGEISFEENSGMFSE